MWFTNDNNARDNLYSFVPVNLFKKGVFQLIDGIDYSEANASEVAADVICRMQARNYKQKKAFNWCLLFVS